MATVWFLIALIALPGIPAMNYKGYYAYYSLEECEMQRAPLENFIANMELQRGKTTFYIRTFCLEMDVFQDQLDKYEEKKQKGVGLGGQQMGA